MTPALRVPVNEPLLTANAKKYVMEAMNTGWVSSAGTYLGAFENAFAQYIGVRHAVFVTSGTAALHLALLSLDIGPGDEVIVPNFTMIASAFAVVYTGATPVFVDVDPETYNIDPKLLEEKITKRTKAIMPVHIYGHACDMDPIMHLTKSRNIAIVEDAAEVHGATYKGKKCGSIGLVNAFSFYGNKIITTGEGGMVCTNDDAIALRVRSLKDLAHSVGRRFVHTEIGYNYRPTNLQAAVGLGQLEEMEDLLRRKRAMAAYYAKRLGKIAGLRLPITKEYAENVYWMYAVLVEDGFGMSRDALCAKLKDMGVDTREFFFPCHSQPALKGKCAGGGHFPVTEDIAERGLYLPSGLAITDEQLDYVCTCVEKIASAH